MNTTHTREEEEEEEEEENNNRKNMGPRSRSRPRPPRPYLSFFFFLITCQSSIIATILVVNGDLHRGDIVPTSSRMQSEIVQATNAVDGRFGEALSELWEE